MRRLPALLAALLAVVLPLGLLTSTGPASAASNTDVLAWSSGEPTFTPPGDRPDNIGVVYQGTWNILSDSQRGVVLDRLAQAGVTWIKMDLGWKSLQPKNASSYSSGDLAEWDKQIREVRARGFKILAQFNWAPAWASGTSNRNGRPKDPNQFATAAAYVAKRYNGSTVASDLKIEAMELWNEPNLSDSWNPSPSSTRVSSFAELIKKAGPAIKKANPNMTVVTGGLTAVDTDWISEFYKTSGVIGTYDGLGVHPYQSPGDASPETYDAAWGKYYMKHLAQLDKLMTSKGDGAKIWATEFGWSSHSNSSSTPGWARGVSEAKQAEYLVRSMPVMGAVSRVKAAFWYASVVTNNGDAQYDNYGIFRRDMARKPVWYGLRCAAAGVCGSGSSSGSSPATVKTLIGSGSAWRYHDKGVDLGKDWRAQSYDHSAWPKSAAQFGYGDGDEKTVVSYGSSASNKRPTTYFRITFDAGTSLSGIKGLRLSGLIDDGAKVYLNGTEIWRYNLTSGTVGYSTLAKSTIGGAAESTWVNADVSSAALKTGSNVLAVEVHQDSPSSSDLSFDLKVTTR